MVGHDGMVIWGIKEMGCRFLTEWAHIQRSFYGIKGLNYGRDRQTPVADLPTVKW